MKNSNLNSYILSTNVRDENNILEWIIYHLLIGFDRILIIDHMSKVPVSSVIEKYSFKNRVDIITSNKTGPVKLYFLNEIVIPYMKQNCKKYFIHLDGDEYINLNDNYDNIKDLLDSFPYDILTLNWITFGSNHKEKNDNKYKCLLPTYTRCGTNINFFYKCFVKMTPNLDKFVNPHHIINKGNTKYTNIKEQQFTTIENTMSNYNSMKPHYESFKDIPAFINHYSIQSKEDYNKRKVKRPRDDIFVAREFRKKDYMNNNDIVYDNLNQKYYKTIELVITQEITLDKLDK